MLGKNRRLEKSKDHIEFLEKTYRLDQDYTPYENEGLFLEGTSSLVMDRINRIAYMGISARSDVPRRRAVREGCDGLVTLPSAGSTVGSSPGSPHNLTTVESSVGAVSINRPVR